MNIVFFLGKEIEKGKFKFIIDKKVRHKSKYTFKFELIDGNIVDMIAYDEVADYIVQNRPEYMLIRGNLKNEEENKIEVEINGVQGFNYDFHKYELERGLDSGM